MAKTKAKCIICGNIHPTHSMRKVLNPKTHYSFICESCMNSEDDYWSNEANAPVTTGVKAKRFPITTGFEFETSANMNQDRLRVLESYGFVATEDGSISGHEYKSPVFHNLNGIAKLMYSVCESPETGAGIPDEDCGTHVNVWCDTLDEDDFWNIRAYYRSIFRPLWLAVRNDSDHDKLFGRKMNDWCAYCDCDIHKSMVNMERNKVRHPRIEFRICKYTENAQFMNCLKFANECMKAIAVNFCAHYYGSNMETIQHKADLTGKKLVKIYNKYRGL